MYVQKGGVKFSVVNGSGKEAVVDMFGPNDFLGEGCMAGQSVRMGTATAITPTTLLVIDKSELLRVLHAEHELPALPNRIAVVGNYLPRRCGIATFTTDLCDAIHAEYSATELLALPVNDTEEGYAYPARVRFELSEDNLASYRQAADFLNFSNIDLLCLHHEYGIFGGRAGGHILEFLRRMRMPVATTLHTVLRDPNPDQRAVMEEIAILSDRMIVMSQHSVQILQEVFRVPIDKIDLWAKTSLQR